MSACSHCGAEMDGSQSDYCPSCGAPAHAPQAAGTAPSTTILLPLVAVFTGLIAGIVLTLALYTGGGLLADIGRSRHPAEFGVSRGSAAFYAIVLVALGVALTAFLTGSKRKSRSLFVQTFTITGLVVALGGMALCNLFSFGSLFGT